MGRATMRYHNITKDDMLNGDGLRVVLWVSGCSHHCPECQNPVTWDPKEGLLFGEKEKEAVSYTHLDANAQDIRKARENHMPEGLVDRLMLNESRISGMAEGLRQIAGLDDPIGDCLLYTSRCV